MDDAGPSATGNGGPLLRTKLHAPRRRRGTVARARLNQRLGGVDLPAVVLVSAPAGFGKTTLLTEWLPVAAEAGLLTAWVSLDRRDNDPSLFWSYVIAAVQSVVPTAGAEATRVLQTSPAELENVVGSLVNDLAGLSGELVLVLDDFHVVESVEVHDAMRFLLEHLPPHVHLILAGRADPPWPLAGLRAGGSLLEVRAADLRFTATEVAAYLNDASGLNLSAPDLEALEARTEGWIAALQLAAISLQGRHDPSAFIAEFAGDDRFVVDYLADEVLDRQPDEIRSFLVDTSILSRLSAPLCAAVTGHTEAKSMLEALERSNLFLIPLDDRRLWYRYHHLFRDVLRARLLGQEPERIDVLHRRAGAWLEAGGDRAEAIRHAMAAGDFAKAAELVELLIPVLRRARRDATQRELLDALPEEVFVNRPVLNLARVGAHMVTGDVKGVEAILDDIEASVGACRPIDELIVHDHDEYGRLPAQVATYRAGLALLRRDYAAAVAHGERTAELCGPDDHLSHGAALALIGLARWADGDLESAAGLYSTAIAEFETAEYLADILGCSLGLADIEVGLGRLGAAERTLHAGLELAAAHGPLRGSADLHIALAELHLERDELDSAAERLRMSLDLGERFALPQHAHRWRVVDARLRAIEGDHEAALELLREAQRCYDTDYSPNVKPVAATIARVRLAAGDIAAAERWVAAAGVDVDDPAVFLREYEHLTLARVLLARNSASDAVELLTRILVDAEAGGRTGAVVEAGMLLALAYQACDETAVALAVLDKALTRAQPAGLVRMFIDAGRPMIALLDALSRTGVAAQYATDLLAAGGHRTTSHQQGLVDKLSTRELDVLRLLRTDLTGPEIAAELVVSLNTVRTHTKNIFAKLGVTNRRAAVRRAHELGL